MSLPDLRPLSPDLSVAPQLDAAAMAAVLDRQATAAVVAMPAATLPRAGLPWSRIDRICIAGMSFDDAKHSALLKQCVEMVLPHLHGPLVVEQSIAAPVRALLANAVEVETFTLNAVCLTTEWLDAPSNFAR